LEMLPAVAVRVAVCVPGTVAATVAEKAALVAPAAIETLAGTVTRVLPLVNFALKPPVGAAPLSFTVQVETPAGPRVKGAQVRLLSWIMEITPAAPVAGIEPPDTSAAIVPVIGIVVEVSTAPDATVNVAVANMPSLSTFEFKPSTTQVVLPTEVEQVMLLPALVAFAAAETATLEMSDE
jgi:hypothetical protein